MSVSAFAETGKKYFTNMNCIAAVTVQVDKTNPENSIVTYFYSNGDSIPYSIQDDSDFQRLVVPVMKRSDKFAHLKDFKYIDIFTEEGLDRLLQPCKLFVNASLFRIVHHLVGSLHFSAEEGSLSLWLEYGSEYQGLETDQYLATIGA